MSMFHELMMRKKEEIMYLVIKGNLTQSPDGVFSGFSSANYLKLSPIDTSSFQFVFKITTSATFGQFECIIVENTATTYKSRVQISPYGRIMLLLSSGGTSWDIADNVLSSQVLSNNTDYYIKFVFDGTKYVVSFSADGQTYETAITVNSTITLRQLPYIIGYNTANATAFGGSIDLNKSYIKLGSTKYNLQAVVGYTVVGSPTITDGVVSGFSNANYLLLGDNVPYSNNFEMVFKITTGSSFSSTGTIFEGSSSNNGLSIAINTSKYLYVSAGNGSWIVNQAGTTTLSANTTYYVKFSCKNNVYKLELSTDNINWNTEISVESSSVLVTTSAKSIGYSTRFSGRVFSGSIDMNETYIKVNNKLWFNGQQA